MRIWRTSAPPSGARTGSSSHQRCACASSDGSDASWPSSTRASAPSTCFSRCCATAAGSSDASESCASAASARGCGCGLGAPARRSGGVSAASASIAAGCCVEADRTCAAGAAIGRRLAPRRSSTAFQSDASAGDGERSSTFASIRLEPESRAHDVRLERVGLREGARIGDGREHRARGIDEPRGEALRLARDEEQVRKQRRQRRLSRQRFAQRLLRESGVGGMRPPLRPGLPVRVQDDQLSRERDAQAQHLSPPPA
jgi:hypothetical protein